MKYNIFKKSGMKASAVSFGCMSLQSDHKQAASIIAQAVDSGINLFDTADLYEKGANETLLGNAIKGRRNDILLSTKVGNRWKNDGSGWDWCPDKKYILSAVDESLRRLQTDHIDLYLLHGGTIEDPVDEVVEAFEKLKEVGKIRAYGLSSIRPNVIREYANRSNIEAVMTQYSFLDRRPEEETLDLLLENQIGVLARGTVAGGLLIDKPAKPYLNYSEEEVRDILNQLGHNKPVEMNRQQTVVQYVLAHPAVTSAVMGIRTEVQLDQALSAVENSELSAVDYQKLHVATQANAYKEHR